MWSDRLRVHLCLWDIPYRTSMRVLMPVSFNHQAVSPTHPSSFEKHAATSHISYWILIIFFLLIILNQQHGSIILPLVATISIMKRLCGNAYNSIMRRTIRSVMAAIQVVRKVWAAVRAVPFGQRAAPKMAAPVQYHIHRRTFR